MTLLKEGITLFPKTVHTHETKHLRELACAAPSGHRTVILLGGQHRLEALACAVKVSMTQGIEFLPALPVLYP